MTQKFLPSWFGSEIFDGMDTGVYPNTIFILNVSVSRKYISQEHVDNRRRLCDP